MDDAAIKHAYAGEQTEAVLPTAYMAIDASLWEFFVQMQDALQQNFKYRRYTLTSGSARYIMTSGAIEPNVDFGSLTVQAISGTHTHIHVLAGENNPALAHQLVEFLLQMFLRWLDYHHRRMRALLEKETPAEPYLFFQAWGSHVLWQLQRFVGQPAKRSRRQTWPEDDWAWEQVNIHSRDRMDVRREWFERQSPGREIKDPERSFRHAVNSERKR